MIDDDLIERMVADTGTGDALPLLAYTLRRMWDNEDFRKDIDTKMRFRKRVLIERTL